MKDYKDSRILLVAALCLLAAINAFAQWPDEPTQNLSISNQPGEQVIAKIATTSDGGCYVSFYNGASGNYDMYLQRLDGEGNIQWQENGILISSHPQETWLTDYDMTVDNEDHAIVVFNDIRAGGDWDIYAYRVSPDGDFTWGPDGLTVSDNAGFEPDPKVCVTTDGNVVFAWQEDNVVHLRKVDMAGNDLWDPATITLTSTYGLAAPYITRADNDGVIVQVYLSSGPNYWNPKYIYAHKFDVSGNALWDSEGVAVNTAGGIALWMDSGIASDEAGGAFCYWYDTRNMIHHAYVQHVTSAGIAEWTANGVQLSLSGAELQMNPSLTYNSLTSEVLAFYLITNSGQTAWGVQGQKLNINGELQWGNNGVTFVPLSGQAVMGINAAYQDDGAIVVYQQSADAVNNLVYAIKVDLDGNQVWDTSPVVMSSVMSEKLHMDVDQNGFGQVLAVWGDKRSDDGDIYLQNVNPDGSLGGYGMPGCQYVVGDFNGSGAFNVADIIDAFSFLRTGLPLPALLCECPPGSGNEWAVAMDVNNSCGFNIADIVSGFSRLKTGSPEPVPCELCPPM